MGRVPSPKIIKRKFDCSFYNECLDRAAKEDWDSFACNDCPVFLGEAQVKQDKAPMTDNSQAENNEQCACGKKTISPGSKLCASCMAIKSNEARRVKKKSLGQMKAEKKDYCKCKSGELLKSDPTALTIQFGKHEPILKAIEKQAEEEMRPLDLQVIYILKKHLEG